MKIKAFSKKILTVILLLTLTLIPSKLSAAKEISPYHVFTIIQTDRYTETDTCNEHKNCLVFKTIRKDTLMCTSCNYMCYQLTTEKKIHQLTQ